MWRSSVARPELTSIETSASVWIEDDEPPERSCTVGDDGVQLGFHLWR